MSTNPVRSKAASDAGVARADMKLEVVVIPVSDVNRAKEFYGRLGWRLDADFAFDNGVRVVQFTPHGSGCSVQFGTNVTSAAPGSAQNLYIPGASTAPIRRSPRLAIWRARFGAQRPPMASTRNAPDSATRTGRIGTPSTWCGSRPAKSCRNKNLRREL